jgi:hypothetical protein
VPGVLPNVVRISTGIAGLCHPAKTAVPVLDFVWESIMIHFESDGVTGVLAED